MSTATVPLTGGAFTDLLGPPGSGVSELLDAAPSAGLDLPCRSADNPDLWFGDTPNELERAKLLCGDCPVRAACLASALARHEPWGVWGGEIFERGVVIARKRPRGRPRKEDVARDAAERAAHTQDEVAA
ncbi:WhiB family transcriptional regulator [Actinokineospora xionganensis]|uniref:WhiB family transcriptional regulator n=1 Tax=Actinokineospora xionganensis TaxID=2684470 RepID=UPI001FEA7032|nr:WhiB family transcriptional regulator [Actinokineospora xionganensis]